MALPRLNHTSRLLSATLLAVVASVSAAAPATAHAPATTAEHTGTITTATVPADAAIRLPAAHRTGPARALVAPPTSCFINWDPESESHALYNGNNLLVDTYTVWAFMWECLPSEPGSEYSYVDGESLLAHRGTVQAAGTRRVCQRGDGNGCLGAVTDGAWHCTSGVACSGAYQVEVTFVVQLADGWVWSGQSDGCVFENDDHSTIFCGFLWAFSWPAVYTGGG